MNKNGFIATSLIYSFFLIFITLFLTIIADYLQDKVLLNTIEKGIKDELNSTMSIEDFEVGDLLYFGGEIESPLNNEAWIISQISFDYDKTDGEDNSSITLYEIEPTETYVNDFPGNCITDKKITDDLKLYGNLNDTRLNELLYSTNTEYDILVNNDEIKHIASKCATINNGSIDYTNCIAGMNYFCRKYYSYEIGNNNLVINTDSEGMITITGVK